MSRESTPFNESQRLYSTAEVAKLWGVTRQTVNRYVTAGRLVAIDIAPKGASKQKLRYTPAALDAFIKAATPTTSDTNSAA